MQHSKSEQLILQAQLNMGKIVAEKWQIPEPKEDPTGTPWKEKLASLSESKLERQRAIAIHQMRVSQASTLFYLFKDYNEIIFFLTGETHTETLTEEPKHHDYTYLHHEDKIVEPGWRDQKPVIYLKKAKQGRWFLPPFKLTEEWRVTQHRNLDKIGLPLPHDVVCGINYLKNLRFFNAFRAFESSKGAVILLGELWELLSENGGPAKDSGQEAHFFLTLYGK